MSYVWQNPKPKYTEFSIIYHIDKQQILTIEKHIIAIFLPLVLSGQQFFFLVSSTFYLQITCRPTYTILTTDILMFLSSVISIVFLNIFWDWVEYSSRLIWCSWLMLTRWFWLP